MGRLIDADAFSEYIRKACADALNNYAIQDGLRDEKVTPTIESVREGKWIKISPAGIYECSVCGLNVMTGDIDVYSWCHGCGTKMEWGD